MTNIWELIGLRFLMGMSLAGLMPSISATIRHTVPQGAAGTILGYSTSAQYAGQVIGPLAGGFVGGHLGMRAVFVCTTAIMLGGALFNWVVSRRVANPAAPILAAAKDGPPVLIRVSPPGHGWDRRTPPSSDAPARRTRP